LGWVQGQGVDLFENYIYPVAMCVKKCKNQALELCISCLEIDRGAESGLERRCDVLAHVTFA